jgi:Domain of unknown function (DUF5666)
MSRIVSKLLYLLAALAVGACGGGVETGGTGGTAYVQGTVMGFGSVIVAGVRFDESNALIEDADGTGRRGDELRLGMLVEVESGTIANDASGNRAATATRVRIGSELVGQITSLTPQQSSVAVIGQTVRYSAATVIDGVAGVNALQLGDVVEVHGFFDPAGSYVATRIERRSTAPASFRVRGEVAGLDALARTLRIGTQVFDLNASGIPAGLADGLFVRLVVQTAQVNGRWVVISAAIESRAIGDRDEADVEGLITAFNGVGDFSVNGTRIDARQAPLGAGSLALGARVRVHGRSVGGVLVASTVEFRSDGDAFNEGVDIRDAIASVDDAAQSFVVRGVTVYYGQSPELKDGTLANIVKDQRVRVRGTLSPDRTRVIATRIEFVNN